MDLAWVAALGVLLLVGGLGALAFDTVRRRDGLRAYPFPDSETTLIDEEQLELPSVEVPDEEEPPGVTTLPGAARSRSRFSIPHVRKFIPRVAIPRLTRAHPLRARRALPRPAGVAVAVAISLALVGLGLAAIGQGNAHTATTTGKVVVAICAFNSGSSNADPAQTLTTELNQAFSSASLSAAAVVCTARPASPAQADSELDRLGASIVVWSPGSTGGTTTASVVLSAQFGIGTNAGEWQLWMRDDSSRYSLPRVLPVALPAASGIEPLQPLLLSLVELGIGSYASASRSAAGAEDTLEGGGAAPGSAALIHGVAAGVAGDPGGADKILSPLVTGPQPVPEAVLDLASARFAQADYSGSRALLDRLVGERGTPDELRALALRVRGEALAASGDPQGALNDLDESLRLRPNGLTAHLYKAELLYKQAQPDLARAELETVTKADPEAAPAYRLLGLVWLMLGRPEDALASLDRAGTIYDRWASGFRADEARAQVTGDSSAGEQATSAIVSINREIGTLHLYRGMALADKAKREPSESFFGGLWRRARGQKTTNEKATAELQEALRLDPGRADILLELGTVYEQAGDPGSAARAYQQAMALNPTVADPYFALARLQGAQGNRAEAATTLNDLLNRAPQTYSAYEQLYELYNSAADKDKASSSLERGIAVEPATPADHLWRGKFLHLLGKDDDALSDLQSATADPSLWEAHLIIGEIEEQKGRGPDALAQFQAVLTVQPNEPDALLEAAKLLVLAGQGEEAGKLFSRLTTLVPNSVPGHIAYSQLLAAEGKPDMAVAEARRAVQVSSESADAHFALGLAYEAQKNWPGASEQFQATAHRDPSRLEALIRLAESLFREDKYADSLKASQAAINIRGDDPQAYRWRAEAQFALRDPDAALHSLGLSLQYSPQLPESLALTARAYQLKGDIPSALHYARAAVSAAPSSSVGLLALGDVQLAGGQPQDALKTFEQAVQLGPDVAEADTGMGQAYAALGSRDQAQKMYLQASAEDATYAPAHLFAGHLLVEANQWDDALREYSQAVSERPHWPEALYYLGRAYTQRKDLQNAARAFRSATDGCPNLVEAWYGLGIAQRGLGQRAEAVAALKNATQLNPGYADGWLYLGLTYEESGDTTSARDAFTRARDQASSQSTRDQADQGLSRLK